MVHRLGALLALLVLPLALLGYFWPTISGSPNIVPGYFNDTAVSLWSFNWVDSFIYGHVPSLYNTQALFSPAGASLLLHNLSEAILIPGVVLIPGWDLALRYTLLCYLIFVLNALAAFLLSRSLGASLLQALFLGLLFSMHPWLVGHLAGGHINLISVAPLLLLVRAIINHRGRWSALVLVAIWTGFVAYTDFYQLWFAILIGLGISAIERQVRPLIGIILGLGIAAPKLVPAALLSLGRSYTPNHDPLRHSLDLMSLIVPSATQMIGSAELAGQLRAGVVVNFAEAGGYIGLAAIAVVIAAIYQSYRARAWSRELSYLGLAIVFVLLAFGPQLVISGVYQFDLPFYALMAKSPLAPPVPARFMLPALIMLLIAITLALQRLGLIAKCIFLCMALIEFWPAPLLQYSLPSPDVFHQLGNTEGIRLVDDLSLPEWATYHQLLHKRPISGGFLARRPRRAEHRLERRLYRRYIISGRGELLAAQQSFAKAGVDALIIPKNLPDVCDRTRLLTGSGPKLVNSQFEIYLSSDIVPNR